MPAPTFISLTAPSLPIGYCFSTWNQLAIDLFTGAFGVLPGSLGIGFNYGSAIPGVNDQNKPWVRLNADGSDAGTWTFAFGTWVKEKQFPPAGPNDWRGIWVGTEADLWAFDGGDGVNPSVTPPTKATGSFYEVDTAFAARTIVGVGTLPLATTVLAVGDLGGADEVTLTLPQIPAHSHQAQAPDQTGSPNNDIWGSSPMGATSLGVLYPSGGGLGGPNQNPIRTTLKNAGGDPLTGVTEGHSSMPPFYTAYIIRRTGRSHYTI